jgi:hypothetical protein
VNAADLQPRRHEPPEGWSRETFEAVTDALAAALVAAVRRQEERTAKAQEAVGQ